MKKKFLLIQVFLFVCIFSRETNAQTILSGANGKFETMMINMPPTGWQTVGTFNKLPNE